jgi:hypothetical protein
MSEKKKRTPEELWIALEEQARKDDAERIQALSDKELDTELREGGFDPAKVRQEGAAFAKMLLDRREREQKAAARTARMQARLEEREARRGTLPKPELVKRIAIARADPRLQGNVAVGFRNRDTTEATVPELEGMLEELEELIDAATDDDGRSDN